MTNGRSFRRTLSTELVAAYDSPNALSPALPALLAHGAFFALPVSTKSTARVSSSSPLSVCLLRPFLSPGQSRFSLWRLETGFFKLFPAMQLLGLGLIPFFLSTIFQYVFAALDAQKSFFRDNPDRFDVFGLCFS